MNTAVCTENMLESFQHSPRAGGMGGGGCLETVSHEEACLRRSGSFLLELV